VFFLFFGGVGVARPLSRSLSLSISLAHDFLIPPPHTPTITGCLPGYAGNPEGWKPPDTTRTLELAGQICILCSDEGDVQTTTRLRTASICEEPTFGEVAGGGDIEKEDEMEGGAAGNSTAPPPITTRRRPGM
jgi:hypothetical protein